jgi:H+/Cl- antiporter ClcA
LAPDAQGAGQPSGAEILRLVGLGALIGVPAALAAAGFLALVHELENGLWSGNPAWYLVVGLPVAGAALVVTARELLPGDGGHPPLEGLSAGLTPLSYAPGIVLAALGTLSFGAALGPEAPLIAIGSVAGLAVAALARLAPKEKAVLGSAGSFSAISALFGGPAVGGLLMIEGGLSMGTALIPTLLPGFVAAAIGYVLFVGLGDWGGLSSQPIAVPHLPAYGTTRVEDLLIAVAVGIVAALIITMVRRGAGGLADKGPKRWGMPAVLLSGGLAVGLLAQVADWLGADSQDVLFSGQAAIPDVIATDTTKIVLVLLVAKAIAYGVSLGCGFRGGPVFPAIFLGVGVATLPIVWFDRSPTLAVAVGAAAGMTATTKLILTPIVFAALLVGSRGVHTAPAAVLAAVAAWLTVAATSPRG